MPIDPRHRLERRYPGEGIGDHDSEKIADRHERPERASPLPDRERTTRTGATRTTRGLADPKPNAPQLIRLVRYPFRLDTVRPTRQTVLAPTERGERRPFEEDFKAALAEAHIVRSTSPVVARPRPFTTRPSSADIIPPRKEPS